MLYAVFVFPPRHVHIPQTLQSMAVFMLQCILTGPRY